MNTCLTVAVEAACATDTLLDLVVGGAEPHAAAAEPDPVDPDHHLCGSNFSLLQRQVVRGPLDPVGYAGTAGAALLKL